MSQSIETSESDSPERWRISIRTLAPPGTRLARWLGLIGPAVDRLLGIAAIDAIYQSNNLEGLPPFDFSSASLRAIGASAQPTRTLVEAGIPTEGPLLIVCNHPFGAIEALVLADALRGIRHDVRFLANAGLRVFRELHPLLIATNPLRVTQKNLSSIRRCEAHLRAGGVLVLFPAGKVSFHQRDKRRITDGPWNRLVGRLALATGAPIMPIFFHGTNSGAFHTLGRLWDRSKLFLLPRELLRKSGHSIRYSAGAPIPGAAVRHLDARGVTAYARLMCYAQDFPCNPARAPSSSQLEQLAPAGDVVHIEQEIDALPGPQHLLEFKNFCVGYALADQAPALMADIARGRERVFRMHDEGSGRPLDSDEFDRSYVQLFVWDRAGRGLVGAYRMGRTDLLLAQTGPSGIYLSHMFDFGPEFHDPAAPSLELGRSFIVPEHQKSFHALYLLWQGIGRYLAAHPQYRRLYGTVSLSRQYDERAVAMLCDALVEPSMDVRPRQPLARTIHPEWRDYRAAVGRPDLATLSAMVRSLDADGKNLPVLLRHYMKLGARFHCVGIDPNFNDTPGLLLSVDVPALGPKILGTFLGPAADDYLAWAG